MTYWYYKSSRDNQWRWRLRADNNKIIAVSGEGYIHKADCLRAITLVKGSDPAQVKQSAAPS